MGFVGRSLDGYMEEEEEEEEDEDEEQGAKAQRKGRAKSL